MSSSHGARPGTPGAPDEGPRLTERSPAARRQFLAMKEAEAEDAGRPDRAAAFHRLGLLAEVEECLACESPAVAEAVALFSEEAMERLGRRDDERIPAQVLSEATVRWGEYLALIDPDFDKEPTAPDAAETAEDTPSAIDEDLLLQMLGGGSKGRPSQHARTPANPREATEPGPRRQEEPPTVLRRVTPAGPPQPPPASLTPPHDSDHGRLRQPIAPPVHLKIDPELRETFLEEATDLFDRIETLVLSLKRGLRHSEILYELGRCFHTLKGAAGSVGLTSVAGVVHASEERLGEGAGEASDDLVDHLHELLHYLESVFLTLRRGAAPPLSPAPPPARPPASVGVSLAAASPSSTTEKSGKPTPPEPAASQPSAFAPSPAPAPATASRAETSAETPSPDAKEPPDEGPVRVSAERVDELMDLASELISRRGLWVLQSGRMKDFATQARACRIRLAATLDRIRDHESLPRVEGAAGKPRREPRPGLAELLHRLAEQAEDLAVLSESAQASAKPLADNSDALARLSLQLWESLQAVRIVPVKGLFQRLTRVARDAARVEGREIEVEFVGEDTGVDRALQDKAFEPLLHVVRNAVSHGIESQEERVKAGKPAAGRITLKASRSGSTLTLSVQDEGRGLDYQAIAAKGRKLGLIGAEETPGVDRLNALIFQPGFSTREAANQIAGRGVGMDVVSQEVGRLHGTVSLSSEPGKGTCLSLCLPARLSLQQAMILRLDGQSFALPVELIELASAFDPAALDTQGAFPRVSLRDQWVPVIFGREALGMPPAGSLSCPKLLLIRADGESIAIVVDSIEGTRELVFKPVGALLAGHPFVSGTGLTVTGEVIFALNPSGLARWVRGGSVRVRTAPAEAGPKGLSVLVVDDSISVRKVVVRQLRAMGHQVREVSDGLEALGKLRVESYSLIISDLEMPRMDGFELLAELRRLEIASTVPVLVASTKADPDTRRRVKELGARDFLPKPIDPEELASKIRTLLGGHDRGPRLVHAAPEHASRQEDRTCLTPR